MDEGTDVMFGFRGTYAIVTGDEDGELTNVRHHRSSRQRNALGDWRPA